MKEKDFSFEEESLSENAYHIYYRFMDENGDKFNVWSVPSFTDKKGYSSIKKQKIVNKEFSPASVEEIKL